MEFKNPGKVANKDDWNKFLMATKVRLPSSVNPYDLTRLGPKVIKLFSCSTQLSTKFILLINVNMPRIVGILTFISMINTPFERECSGSVVECLTRDRGLRVFEPHWHHCFVSLSKTH